MTVRPIFWGSLYLTSIFVFAFVYSLSGIPFSQSTTQSDRNYLEQIDVLENNVELALDYLFGLNDLAVSDVEIKPTSVATMALSFSVFSDPRNGTKFVLPDGSALHSVLFEAEIVKKDSMQFMWGYREDIGPGLTISIKELNIDKQLEGFFGDMRGIAEATIYGRSEQLFKEFLGQHVIEKLGWDAKIELFLDRELYVQGDQFVVPANAILGEVGGTIQNRQSFIRMLYFSSVTATTLGYGDIVPVNDAGRLLVVVQTILSVVLIGIFLNSVAARR